MQSNYSKIILKQQIFCTENISELNHSNRAKFFILLSRLIVRNTLNLLFNKDSRLYRKNIREFKKSLKMVLFSILHLTNILIFCYSSHFSQENHIHDLQQRKQLRKMCYQCKTQQQLRECVHALNLHLETPKLIRLIISSSNFIPCRHTTEYISWRDKRTELKPMVL